MFIFVTLMGVGAVIGYSLRKKSAVHKVPILIQAVVCCLLFLLGFSIGMNKLIIDHLSYFCEQAAVIAFLSITGSIVVSVLVYHFYFKKGSKNEK